MARANRHYIPGHVWHLTHRCHKREYLLKFGKDRLRWMQWLFEAGEHLLRCLVYVGLNMVRCGVVSHPGQWPHGGYNEIQRPRRKNILIDYEKLGHLSGFNNFEDFQSAHRRWVQSALSDGKAKREERWTQSIATGSRSFVEAVKMQMGSFATGRRVQKKVEGFELQESQSPYNVLFDTEKNDIEGENLWFWNE